MKIDPQANLKKNYWKLHIKTLEYIYDFNSLSIFSRSKSDIFFNGAALAAAGDGTFGAFES